MARDKDRKLHPNKQTTFNGNWAFIWYGSSTDNNYCNGFAYVWSSDVRIVNWTYNPAGNVPTPTLQFKDDSGK